MQIVCFISCFLARSLSLSPLGLIANIKGDRATQPPPLRSLHGKKANLRQDALFIFIKLVSVHQEPCTIRARRTEQRLLSFPTPPVKKVSSLFALSKGAQKGSQRHTRPPLSLIECTFNFFSNYFRIASLDKRECLRRRSLFSDFAPQTKSVTLIDV